PKRAATGVVSHKREGRIRLRRGSRRLAGCEDGKEHHRRCRQERRGCRCCEEVEGVETEEAAGSKSGEAQEGRCQQHCGESRRSQESEIIRRVFRAGACTIARVAASGEWLVARSEMGWISHPDDHPQRRGAVVVEKRQTVD